MSNLALQLIEKEKRERSGTLDLGNCGLTDIPMAVFELDWLEELSFSNETWDWKKGIWVDSKNQGSKNIFYLKTLPDFFKKFKKLKVFSFGGNSEQSWKLKEVKVLNSLVELRYLDLRFNRIRNLKFLEGLHKLQYLDLFSNEVTNINSLGKLNQLIFLDFGQNDIIDINCLKNLDQLKYLNISDNKIYNINALENLNSLEKLYFSFNRITNGSFLGKLTNLRSLDISHNKITDHTFLEKLVHLKVLYAYESNFSNISIIKNLAELESLNISNNQIVDYSLLEKFTNLRNLELHTSNIADCSFLLKLTKLQSLNLRSNQISDISFLTGLTNLQSLYISNNQINDISFLKGLSNLVSLDLSENKISNIGALVPLLKSNIPVTMERFGSGIRLYDNPLNSPPISVVEKGREAILNWFAQLAEGEAPFYESKLMILGQGAVGKTTFFKLQKDPAYKVKPGKGKATLGVDIQWNKAFPHQQKEEQEVQAHLWDFGGQDIQKMLHQFFITENGLYLLVSNKRKDEQNFDYWFQIINLLGPKSKVIVLENPIDIDSANKDFPLNDYRERFPELSIKRLEVNLQQTRGEDKLKWQLLNEEIAKQLSELEIVNRPVPQKWTLVRDALKERIQQKYIRKDDFYKLCKDPAIGMSTEDADLCLFYFRVLGDVVHFKDHALRNYIFLNHNWLIQGLYYILDDPAIKKANGRFTWQQAKAKWGAYQYLAEEKDMMLHLLLKDQFDICYKLPNEKDTYITPLLLKDDKPGKWPFTPQLRFRYHYAFLPHGMFSRFIVRVHEKLGKEPPWASGVWLVEKHDGETAQAEVRQYFDWQQVIDIKLHGGKEARKRLLDFIRSALDDLHKEFKNIQFKQTVACNCDTCIPLMAAGKEPDFHDYDELLEMITYRNMTVKCRKSGYKEVNIGRILGDVVVENLAYLNKLAKGDRAFIAYLKEMGIGIHLTEQDIQVNVSNTNKPVVQAIAAAQSVSQSAAAAEAAQTNVQIENEKTAAPPARKEKKMWHYLKRSETIIVIVAGLVTIIGWSLKDVLFPPAAPANTVTVLAHAEDRKDIPVLPGRGMVKLIYGDAPVSKQINNEGEATFKQVPEHFFQSDAKVEIHFHDPQGEPYRVLNPDSLYTLTKGQYIALPVKLYGLGELRGIVKDFASGAPLDSVRIVVNGIVAFSNQYGEYQLSIPPEAQRKFQSLRAFKEGYQVFEQDSLPLQTGREVPILMKK